MVILINAILLIIASFFNHYHHCPAWQCSRGGGNQIIVAVLEGGARTFSNVTNITLLLLKSKERTPRTSFTNKVLSKSLLFTFYRVSQK